MCTVLLPPGDNPIAVNKYIKFWSDDPGWRKPRTHIGQYWIRRDVMGLDWIGFIWLRTGTRGGALVNEVTKLVSIKQNKC